MARPIDPAALAAATLAAAIAVMMGAGPYTSWSIAIGLTLLALLVGYHFFPNHQNLQSFAVATTTAVCIALVLAYPVELLLDVSQVGPSAPTTTGRQPDSNIPPWGMLVLWALLVPLILFLERHRRRRLTRDETKEDVRTTDAEPHRVFEPPNATEMLRGWFRHAHKQRDRHDLSARRLQARAYVFGSIAVAFSAVVGTSVFASITEFNLTPSRQVIAKVIVGALSVTAAVLTTVHTSLNFGPRAQAHQVAAGNYKALIWHLEEVKASQAGTDEDIKEIRDTLRRLEIESPVVPASVYDFVEERYRDVKWVKSVDELF